MCLAQRLFKLLEVGVDFGIPQNIGAELVRYYLIQCITLHLLDETIGITIRCLSVLLEVLAFKSMALYLRSILTVLLLISQYFVQTNLQLDNVDNLHY